jgi:hypothetical protein
MSKISMQFWIGNLELIYFEQRLMEPIPCVRLRKSRGKVDNDVKTMEIQIMADTCCLHLPAGYRL